MRTLLRAYCMRRRVASLDVLLERHMLAEHPDYVDWMLERAALARQLDPNRNHTAPAPRLDSSPFSTL